MKFNLKCIFNNCCWCFFSQILRAKACVEIAVLEYEFHAGFVYGNLVGDSLRDIRIEM